MALSPLDDFLNQIESIDGVRVQRTLNTDGSVNTSVTMGDVARCIWDVRDRGDVADKYLDLLEQHIVSRSDLSELICTCTLEIIQSRSIKDSTDCLTKRLRSESRKYCKAMDDFHGAATPGV